MHFKSFYHLVNQFYRKIFLRCDRSDNINVLMVNLISLKLKVNFDLLNVFNRFGSKVEIWRSLYFYEFQYIKQSFTSLRRIIAFHSLRNGSSISYIIDCFH